MTFLKLTPLLLLFLAIPLAAEDSKIPIRPSTAFGIYPPIMDLDCVAGQKVSTSVKVDNPNALPASFDVVAIGTTATGDENLVSKPIATLPADHLARHVTLEAEKVVIPGKSYKDVAIYLDVPSGLKGTQYAGLVVSNTSPSLEESGLRKQEYRVDVGLGVQPAIGIVIKCHIKGTETFKYILKKVEIFPSQGNKPLGARVELKSTGNAEIQFLPTLILLDSSNKVVARLKAERRATIYPGSLKAINFQPVYKEIQPGRYKAVLSSNEPKYNLPPLEQSVQVGR